MARQFGCLLLTALAVVVLVGLAGPTVNAGKTPPGGSGPSAADKKMATELSHVIGELNKCQADYGGNRGNAINQINGAITALGGKGVPGGSGNLTQQKSDQLLRTAVKQLSGVQQQLSKVPNSPPHAAAAQGVRNAIGALESALSGK
jgi:hypothetical protein